MNKEKSFSSSASSCCIFKKSDSAENANAHGKYTIECRDLLGNLKWEDVIDNLVTTQGKNDALDKYLSGAAYTASWYVGLISLTSFTSGALVTDTAATHEGWIEFTGYSEATRATAGFSAASGGSKSLSSNAIFSINANGTVKGCFLASVNAKGATTGILYSAGLFFGGDKVLQSGDTINVNYSASL